MNEAMNLDKGALVKYGCPGNKGGCPRFRMVIHMEDLVLSILSIKALKDQITLGNHESFGGRKVSSSLI